jgi:hypothetical protein
MWRRGRYRPLFADLGDYELAAGMQLWFRFESKSRDAGTMLVHEQLASAKCAPGPALAQASLPSPSRAPLVCMRGAHVWGARTARGRPPPDSRHTCVLA